MAPLIASPNRSTGLIRITWAGVSWTPPSIGPRADKAIGKNISTRYNRDTFGGLGDFGLSAWPTEIMLAPNQTFSAECGPYNIWVIPENN